MVSFDVESLYTNIPITDALLVIKDLLSNDTTLQYRTNLLPDQILELLEFLLRTTFFTFNGNSTNTQMELQYSSKLRPGSRSQKCPQLCTSQREFRQQQQQQISKATCVFYVVMIVRLLEGQSVRGSVNH